jgi:alpha-galactosidase
MFAIGPDYHAQLENYGNAIRILDHARTSSPTLIGWWSWTAYYYGVTEGTMQTNADWLAQNLLTTGYRYFQIDEGYQFARGEYATADGKAFPDGMAATGHHVGKRWPDIWIVGRRPFRCRSARGSTSIIATGWFT